jgi:hypothetical protein
MTAQPAERKEMRGERWDARRGKIFPPRDPVGEEQNNGPVSHTVSGANASRSGGGPVS